MAFVTADWVEDTSTSTGTGNFTVANTPPNNNRTLNDVLATSDTFPYTILHTSNGERETGIGTYNGSHVFVRTTVISSTNSNALVNFSVGTKKVFIGLSGLRAALLYNATANSVLVRADAAAGPPSALSLAASELLGRGASGNISAISLATHLQMVGSVLQGNKAPTFQLFNSTNTWTKSTGCRFICVLCAGPGGGGAGADGSASTAGTASGGGAGGVALKWMDATSLTSELFTVGAGASGGAAGQNNGGSAAGNTTSFGSHCSATGGAGGLSGSTGSSATAQQGGAGGTATGGDINIDGGSGFPGLRFSAANALAGSGGSNAFGGGGTAPSSNGNGTNGTGFGGGGSGGRAASTATDASGGAGADGGGFVWEFY